MGQNFSRMKRENCQPTALSNFVSQKTIVEETHAADDRLKQLPEQVDARKASEDSVAVARTHTK